LFDVLYTLCFLDIWDCNQVSADAPDSSPKRESATTDQKKLAIYFAHGTLSKLLESFIGQN